MIYKVKVTAHAVEHYVEANSPEEAEQSARSSQAFHDFSWEDCYDSEIIGSDFDKSQFKEHDRLSTLVPKTNDVTYEFIKRNNLWEKLLEMQPNINVEAFESDWNGKKDYEFELTREESDKLGLKWPH